jgi:phosphate transport system substrate-binding protein
MRLVSTLIACLAGALVSVGAHSTDITGAGSTFAAPIYTKWADAYQKSGGGRVNYQGIGSSGGIKQIIAKTVVGGVVPVVNLPGLTSSPA